MKQPLSMNGFVWLLCFRYCVHSNAGVAKYRIVDPSIKTAFVHTLKDSEFMTRVYSGTDIILIHVLSGCGISMQEVFDED